MEIHYDADTDSLYIGLSSQTKYDESEEVAPGFVLDFNASNQVVGIEIEHASKVVELNKLDGNLPAINKRA